MVIMKKAGKNKDAHEKAYEKFQDYLNKSRLGIFEYVMGLDMIPGKVTRLLKAKLQGYSDYPKNKHTFIKKVTDLLDVSVSKDEWHAFLVYTIYPYQIFVAFSLKTGNTGPASIFQLDVRNGEELLFNKPSDKAHEIAVCPKCRNFAAVSKTGKDKSVYSIRCSKDGRISIKI